VLLVYCVILPMMQSQKNVLLQYQITHLQNVLVGEQISGRVAECTRPKS
jgi:hypothetical protein